MASGRIFVGSATESRDIAERVASALEKAGHEPIRWWRAFNSGDITIDRIIELAQDVDGAVFLAGATDKTWYRSAKTMSPRDNVILEYGVFASRLGLRATMLVKDLDTRLPTDIGGVTSQVMMRDDIEGLCSSVVRHFMDVFVRLGKPAYDRAVPVAADPELSRLLVEGDIPQNWLSRALYIGLEGARGWLAVIQEESYIPDDMKLQIREAVLKSVKRCAIRTFVSFGPGDGQMDEQIISVLHEQEELLRYIPVDISDGLLHRILGQFAARVTIPVGILGDFESPNGFIGAQVDAHSSKPLLLGLLGNTLGNLDHRENIFIHDVRQVLSASDFLLLGVSLTGRNWLWANDRKTDPQQYLEGEKRFFATGISRIARIPLEVAVRDFKEHVKVTPGESDVPGTRTITIRHSSGKPICNIRRYDFESLKRWLVVDKNFEILDEQAIFDDKKCRGHALLLLRPRTQKHPRGLSRRRIRI